MSIDFDDALKRSKDQTAFSNGTEFFDWQGNWCDRCLRDAPFRNGLADRGCRLLEVVMLDRTPAEWLDGPRDEHGRYSMADQYHCIEFKAPGGRGSGEPRPKPDPPQMSGLFDRPERRVRMYVQPEAAGGHMTGQRCLVLAASLPRYCPVCDGTGRVLLRAIPDGAEVPSPCLHCGKDRLPVAYLPAYDDQRSA